MTAVDNSQVEPRIEGGSEPGSDEEEEVLSYRCEEREE